MSKVAKNSKFRAAQMVQMAVFGASKWPKLISRKIWNMPNKAAQVFNKRKYEITTIFDHFRVTRP